MSPDESAFLGTGRNARFRGDRSRLFRIDAKSGYLIRGGKGVWSWGPSGETLRGVTWRPKHQHILVLTDKAIYAYDYTMNQLVEKLEGKTQEIEGLAALADGNRFVTTGGLSPPRVWNIQTGVDYALADPGVLRTGRICIDPSEKSIFVVCRRTTKPYYRVIQWDLRTKRITQQFHPDFDGYITTMTVTHNAKRLLLGRSDGKLDIWDVKTGRKLKVLSGHDGAVNCIATSPDSRLAATGGSDKTVRIWQLPR